MIPGFPVNIPLPASYGMFTGLKICHILWIIGLISPPQALAYKLIWGIAFTLECILYEQLSN